MVVRLPFRHVGSRVRMRRKMPAMIQEQLAEALGLDVPSGLLLAADEVIE